MITQRQTALPGLAEGEGDTQAAGEHSPSTRDVVNEYFLKCSTRTSTVSCYLAQ